MDHKAMLFEWLISGAIKSRILIVIGFILSKEKYATITWK